VSLDIVKLAAILRANSGATIMLDNDAWQLYSAEADEPIATEADFPSLPISHGFGLLLALAAALEITIDQP